MGALRTASASAKSQVQALFDSLALEYVCERERQFSFISQKRIVIQMLLGSRGRLLEVGCGPGIMLPDLLAMGFDVRAIDVSAEMIRRAEQRMTGHPLARRCRLAVGDVERLEFGEGAFDAVLAMGVLEYLPASDGALREMVRVLRPGGHLVLTVPNRAAAYHLASGAYLAARRLVGRPRRTAYPARPCLPWVLDRQLATLGMRKIESQACNFIFFPLKELHERASDALNRALTPMSRLPIAPLLGAQYVVKTQKTAWRYA
ncbi:MAG TPA: class I SAM-dependent methyltransferase [Burkholderiales bacterium]|nr:class I SAM-dependent methyltransferase [Burkholderiales bacterium]